MSGFFFISSMIVLFIGGIMLLIDAFGEGMLWGLGCLLIPLPVSLLFIVTHWYQAKKAFFVLVAGGVLLGLAVYSGPQ